MSDASSDLGGIRAGPVERDIEQVPFLLCFPPAADDPLPTVHTRTHPFVSTVPRGAIAIATQMRCGIVGG
jgi:hypothetical protein